MITPEQREKYAAAILNDLANIDPNEERHRLEAVSHRIGAALLEAEKRPPAVPASRARGEVLQIYCHLADALGRSPGSSEVQSWNDLVLLAIEAHTAFCKVLGSPQ